MKVDILTMARMALPMVPGAYRPLADAALSEFSVMRQKTEAITKHLNELNDHVLALTKTVTAQAERLAALGGTQHA